MRRAMAGAAMMATLLHAAGPGAAPLPAEAEPAQVTVLPAPARTVRPGAADTLFVTLRIAPGLHVQANPAAAEFLIPLRLELDASPGVEPGPPVYPPPRIHRLEGTGEVLWVCDDTVTIAVPVELSAEFPECSTVVHGTLSWQACDAKRCYAPRSAPIELRITSRR